MTLENATKHRDLVAQILHFTSLLSIQNRASLLGHAHHIVGRTVQYFKLQHDKMPNTCLCGVAYIMELCSL
jgi:hypothetical protein